MLKPIEKPTRETLVHHPSDMLDGYGNYDSSSPAWVRFDSGLSHQLIELEFQNRQYIRVRSQASRRNSL
jgi:hypothetical protein